MWQAEEPTPMGQEPRRVCGLPVEAGMLFTNAKGVYSSRLEARKTRLLARMTVLGKFLEEDERILYVTTAYSPMGLLTLAAMDGWLYYVAKRAVLVFTDRRLFHVPTTRMYEYRGSVAQVWYRDCKSMRVLHLTLFLKYHSGKKERFRRIAWADRAKIRQLAACVGDFASADNTRAPGAPRERHHLCPRCTEVLPSGVGACPACGLEFKNEREAATWTLVVPGGGFFYGNHPVLGTAVAFQECAGFFLILVAVCEMVRGVQNSAVLLGGAVAILAMLKLRALYEARRFVAEFIPRRLKPLLDEAKAPDAPPVPKMRDPVMQSLIVSLLVLLCVVVVERWRATGFGTRPAQAVPSRELPPSYEQAQIPASSTPAPPSAAQLQEFELSAIEGLRECAALVGRYPESPDSSAPCLREDIELLRYELAMKMHRPGVDGAAAARESVQLQQKYTRITQFVHVCTVLRERKREPAYYGAVVRPGEAERVLLRWQLAPNEYRVIFGDLHAETVAADRLAQLEAAQAAAPKVPVPQRLDKAALEALEGLHACASLFGHYSESPDPYDARLEEDIWQLRQNARSKARSAGVSAAAGTELARLETGIGYIGCFGRFYKNLEREKKEPAYYGKEVKPGEADRVLLRWQLAPNEYWVIFGDLHAETVTADRLAQLEATLPK